MISAEVIAFGHHHYALCRACEWRSAPQENRSDALDRAVVHNHWNHDDDDPRPPSSGADEALLRSLESSSW